MRRITVEEVREAVEKTGLKLTRKRTLDLAEKCGCPIGILSHLKGGTRRFENIAAHAANLGLEMKYADGFIRGFDSESPMPIDDPMFDAGVADGQACAELAEAM